MIADAHVHFFSEGFYRALAAARAGAGDATADAALRLPAELGWTPPGSNAQLADAWVAELDRHGVSRALLIASMHGDEASVVDAVRRHPTRLSGAFMINPAAPDAVERATAAFQAAGVRMVCLFPAMHKVAIDDPRSVAIVECAATHGRAVFVHCGLLTVGVRRKLGLASPFDIRLGDPLAVAAVAQAYPAVPFVIPHFGAGFYREALMAATMAGNVYLDTSSSNGWRSLYQGLTLRDVYARALDVVGVGRLLFGSDSSFFPRGWHRQVFEAQQEVFDALGLAEADRTAMLSGNFARVFGNGIAPRR